jgi:hypothetical protein
MTEDILQWLFHQAPVAVVMGVGLYYFAMRDKRKDKEMREHHKEMIDITQKVTEALANNTNALTNLTQLIHKDHK